MLHRRTGALCVALALAAACAHPRTAPAPDAEPPRDGLVGADEGQSVSEDELRRTRVARPEELLEGRFPGVQLVRVAGGGFTVRIRGISTFYGSGEPLFVIDGMPIQRRPGEALLGINPNDIVRIQVLKDIGSTAAYGLQGANGVVLITTRRPGS
ncbi:MAG TPA: TonB-dependent receptor plug domain-containing protein [Longimicrobium sp.]|nr:TonB-dependent receptor plug domain-containing protein [Longimicrobium sp.]